MTQDFIKKNKQDKVSEFIKRTKSHREDKAIALTNELLAMFIKESLPVLDVHCLIARTKEILNEKFEAIDFRNELVDRIRREFLLTTAGQARRKHIRLNDEDALGNNPDERDKRVEGFAQQLAEKVLSEELLTSDQAYLEDAIENDDQLLLAATAVGYIDSTYEKLLIAISENMRRANDKKWGKDDLSITWNDLDIVLKEKQ